MVVHQGTSLKNAGYIRLSFPQELHLYRKSSAVLEYQQPSLKRDRYINPALKLIPSSTTVISIQRRKSAVIAGHQQPSSLEGLLY